MNMSVTSSANPYAVQTSSYNPYVDNPGGDDSGGSSLPSISGDFTSISSMVAHAGGGGFAAYKFGSQMATDMKSIFSGGFKGVMGGIKNTAITGMKGAGLSALVSAGVSAVSNGVGVATGSVTTDQAVSNVVKDSIGGAVGGLAAVTAGGVGHMLLGRFGTIGTVASVALGAVGGVAGGQLAAKMTEGF